MTIGFIGLGNMSGAIIKGLRRKEAFSDTVIYGFDRNENKRDDFREHCGVAVLGSAQEVAKNAGILVLGIKPQGLDALLEGIRENLNPDQLVVSLAAGKTLDYYAQKLGEGMPVVQSMPNINAKAGASCTALCGNSRVSVDMMGQAEAIFAAIGSVTQLPEEKLSAFTAIAGAGPAFAYLFIDALATAGIKAGLPRRLAQQAACEMVEGSARLVAHGGEHPRALIDQVTSPGGTTIEGMHKLAELGFEHAVHEAVRAVIDKNQRMKDKG